MMVTNPRQPRWSNAQHTSIDLIVTIEGMDAPHTVLRGADLFARADAGEFGAVAAYVEPALPQPTLRALADEKLSRVSNAGISVTLSGGRIALTDTDAVGRAALSELRDAVKPVTWYQSTGALSLSAEDVALIGASVSLYVRGALQTWTALVSAISAGAVTTREQIETPPAPIPAWPSA